MKKVLLACDGSSYSEDAARFLARLPHDDRLEIVVVSVLNVPATNRTSISREWIEQCVAQEDERAKQDFEKIRSMFDGANAALTHVVEEGHVGATIVSVAQKEKPELLLLGAKGRSTVSRLLLGSVSDYVATHAPCSVLVVRPSKRQSSDHPIRMAIAFEDTETARSGLDEVCGVDWGAEPDIRLISVVPATLPYSDEQLQLDHAALETASKQVAVVARNVTSELIENDHSGDGLVNYSEQHECDLVIVSESDRGSLGRLLLGSVSRFVLRHAPCSVWITRNQAPA